MKDSSKLIGENGCRLLLAGQSYVGEIHMVIAAQDGTTITTLERVDTKGNTVNTLVEANIGGYSMFIH